MTTAEIGLFAVIAYAVAFVGQVAYSKKTAWLIFLLVISGFAISCHAIQLHQLIDLPQGQNLSWINLLSLLTWLAALLILLTQFILPITSLNLFLYPVAIVAISLSVFFHPKNILITQYHPNMLLHILFATLVVTLFIICAIQALLLTIQQFCLKQKKMLGLLQFMPALQMMERLLLVEIILCFIALSLFLSVTFWLTSGHTLIVFWPETVLSILLWFIFLILLIGRYCGHWRSITAVTLTILSVGIALVLYLTSHLA